MRSNKHIPRKTPLPTALKVRHSTRLRDGNRKSRNGRAPHKQISQFEALRAQLAEAAEAREE